MKINLLLIVFCTLLMSSVKCQCSMLEDDVYDPDWSYKQERITLNDSTIKKTSYDGSRSSVGYFIDVSKIKDNGAMLCKIRSNINHKYSRIGVSANDNSDEPEGGNYIMMNFYPKKAVQPIVIYENGKETTPTLINDYYYD